MNERALRAIAARPAPRVLALGVAAVGPRRPHQRHPALHPAVARAWC